MTMIAACLSILLGANPTCNAISPTGLRTGETASITIRGDRLGDALDLVLDDEAMRLVSIDEVGPKAITATIEIDHACATGLHPIRVRTSTGISNVRLISVAPYPVVEESEPNDTRDVADPIDLGVTVAGIANNEDADCYSIELTEPGRLSIEIEGMRLGATFDPSFVLFDADGFVVTSSDDSSLLRQDPCASLLLDPGVYTILVRESAYRGNGACHYRMHVTRSPRPIVATPMGARPGESVDVVLLGEVGEPTTATVTVPGDDAPNANGWVPPGVVAIHPEGGAPAPVLIRLADLDSTMEVEPNDGRAEATPIPVPGAACGVLSTPGDTDTFSFEARKGETWSIASYARRLRSPLDPVVRVQRPGGGTLKRSDDDASLDTSFTIDIPEDGRYTVTVSDHLGRGGPVHAYRLEIDRPAPSLRLHSDRRAPVVVTPRGGRTCLMLGAERLGFEGPLSIEASALPEGVTMIAPETPAGIGVVPILFEASPDAPLSHTRTRFDAVASDVALRGAYRQDIELVHGRNRVVFWAHTTDRVPVAVTEPPPCTIELEALDSPVVRSGAVDLRVRVERGEGFDAPIRLEVPFLAPGVQAQRGVSIARGASEATIRLNIRGNARLGDWPILVTGRFDAGGGPTDIATTFRTMRIREPFCAFKGTDADIEQGSASSMLIDVTRLEGFTGEASVELRGLPHGVTSSPVTLDATTDSIVFDLAATGDATPGLHKGVSCVARFRTDEGEVTHLLGGANLRVQRPPPPTVEAPPKDEAPPKVEPNEPPKPDRTERPPTRLEKLRREHAKRRQQEGDG